MELDSFSNFRIWSCNPGSHLLPAGARVKLSINSQGYSSGSSSIVGIIAEHCCNAVHGPQISLRSECLSVVRSSTLIEKMMEQIINSIFLSDDIDIWLPITSADIKWSVALVQSMNNH